MSIELAEKLKRDLTDKFVVVAHDVPELKRFAKLTGKVKTVNMNCRALVEFDGPEDIGWYDIDPTFLSVVDAPQPKQPAKSAAATETKPADKKQPAKKASGGMSPLEMARQQGAATDKPPAATGGPKKLSPLEQARQQDGSSGAKATPAPSGSTDSGKKLSPLELARQQGGFSDQKAEAAPVEEPEPTIAETAATTPEPESKPAATTGSDGKPLSVIEQARQQGAFKG